MFYVNKIFTYGKPRAHLVSISPAKYGSLRIESIAGTAHDQFDKYSSKIYLLVLFI